MKVYIKGLNSCTMRNEKLQQYTDFLEANGHELVTCPEASEAVILWTCGFRQDVLDASVEEIERYQKEIDAELIVGGCVPDIDPDLLGKIFKGKVIAWKDDKAKMEEYFGGEGTKLEDVPKVFVEEPKCDDVEKFREENPDKDATFHDQFIKLIISEGCNYNCSFCSEKLMFPETTSFPEEQLVQQCRDMINKTGCYEVILMSDSVGDYGYDTGTDLPALIQKIRGIDPRVKVALNNMNPESFIRFYGQMVDLIKEGAIRHLNLPIQSASPRMLKLMNRSYTKQHIEKIFKMLNDINFKEFDTHVILGYISETEEDVKETIDFILRHNPKYVLASGFMESVGMPATELTGERIDDDVKRERLRWFYKEVSEAGIICNTDESRLGTDRLRRLKLKK